MITKADKITPMSWCSGSQVLRRSGVCRFAALKICSTLVTIDLWVSTTPAGVRVEPEVYCRNASSLDFGASDGSAMMAAMGFCQSSASASGSASTVSTRGRSVVGVEAKCLRTAVAERLFVNTTVGSEEPSTAVKWPVWPGSFGSYSGTGTMRAYIAPRKAYMYSGELLARMATRSPGLATCCRRTHTALMRVFTCARVISCTVPSRDSLKSQWRISTLSTVPSICAMV